MEQTKSIDKRFGDWLEEKKIKYKKLAKKGA